MPPTVSDVAAAVESAVAAPCAGADDVLPQHAMIMPVAIIAERANAILFFITMSSWNYNMRHRLSKKYVYILCQTCAWCTFQSILNSLMQVQVLRHNSI
jgi:hypothetical protein